MTFCFLSAGAEANGTQHHSTISLPFSSAHFRSWKP